MTDVDSIPCPECGRPLGEHTMTEYRAHTAVHVDMEPVDKPTFAQLTAGTPIADHVDVVASVLELDYGDGSKVVLPAIEFRFSSSHTGPVPPVVFTADNPAIFKSLRKLVAGACDLAPMRAKQRARQIKRGQQ